MDDFFLAQLAPDYSDIRLDTSDLEKSVVFKAPDRKPQRPDESILPWLRLVSDAILKKPSSELAGSFSVEVCEMRYRCQAIRKGVFSLRLCMTSCMSLTDLGIKDVYRKKLLSPELKQSGGLVLISGLPGSGKTTTLAGMISDRLKEYGGFAVTIEDPVEMPLGGFHGETGFCDQMSIEGDETYYDKIVDSLRCFPSGDTSMLALGEIRENDAAAELLRIGIDGHLVLSTIHAKDPIAAVHRVLTMASQGGEMSARSLLANSLKMVVHQRMVNNKPQVSILEVNDKIKATISSGNIDSLRSDLMAAEIKLRAEAGYGR